MSALTASGLHLGTLVAVGWFMRRELLRLAHGLRAPGRDRNMLRAVIAGTAPAAVAGAALAPVADALFSSDRLAGIGLLVTAALLWQSRRARGGQVIEPGLRHAFCVGVAQAAALVPGVSRSGATICAGMHCGLARGEAARFSFLLSVPAVAGAVGLELVRGSGCGSGGGAILVLAAAVAAVAGWCALRLLLRVVVAGKLWVFAPYCAIVGCATLLLHRT